MGKYFGTDGIRGDAETKVTPDLAALVGNSLWKTFGIKDVIIGSDTRKSSPGLVDSFIMLATTGGMHPIKAGVVTTPMIAHYSRVKQILGVMITASHNPYQDNGIKIFNKGFKLTPEEETAIEAHIEKNNFFRAQGENTTHGEQLIIDEYLKIYDRLTPMKSKLKVGYDSAHGATYKIAREVFRKFVADSIQFNSRPNGKNINLKCGSTHMEAIQKSVEEFSLDVGFSFDGDGDRLQAIDSKGVIYDGDMIVYIIASYLKNNHRLKNNGVVLTKMSNLGIIKALNDQGIEVVLSDVGDKNVAIAMEKHDFTIGGESSGHIILSEYTHTGDGLLVAIHLLDILERTKMTFSELTKDVKLYPIQHHNISDVSKEVLKLESVQKKIASLKKILGDDSLLLVRPSGTENLIRITISHQDASIIHQIENELISFIHEEGEKL